MNFGILGWILRFQINTNGAGTAVSVAQGKLLAALMHLPAPKAQREIFIICFLCRSLARRFPHPQPPCPSQSHRRGRRPRRTPHPPSSKRAGPAMSCFFSSAEPPPRPWLHSRAVRPLTAAVTAASGRASARGRTARECGRGRRLAALQAALHAYRGQARMLVCEWRAGGACSASRVRAWRRRARARARGVRRHALLPERSRAPALPRTCTTGGTAVSSASDILPRRRLWGGPALKALILVHFRGCCRGMQPGLSSFLGFSHPAALSCSTG